MGAFTDFLGLSKSPQSKVRDEVIKSIGILSKEHQDLSEKLKKIKEDEVSWRKGNIDIQELSEAHTAFCRIKTEGLHDQLKTIRAELKELSELLNSI